ncbi:lamin tail domain-containing protein 1 isoform X2 [Talpa occidentalis]|uniref:lamin tail domain-containing protein 1 isoform X2 n=1 Tax=Talpa occidentalis TaxID=50954 RepID=UPI0023F62EB8|nr:lamin tail domain-containing protein 1 isoform X2 [Talpa occidentalis]
MEDAYNLKERKETCLQAMMEGRKSREKSPEAQQCGICGLDGKLEIQAHKDTNGHVMMKQHSTVHFYAGVTDSSSTLLPVSQVLSCELPLSHYLSSSQMSGVSTVGQKFANSASQSDNSPVVLDRASTFAISNKHMLSLGDLEPSAIGEGEDYFFSLFGDSKRLSTPSFQKEKSRRHFSVILEEVGQSRSSALGDIKIAEVNAKGLFVKLVNSSLDKELEIGDHILQQNVNGQRVAMYRFLPNIIMPANSTVTVWAAASEAEHKPPSNFLWKELNKFGTSPNYTTILCKPNGEAVAWYTPIHWKQTWEKLETDIEFERCSRVSLISQRQMFHWPTATKTTSEGEQDKSTKDTENFEMEPIKSFLKREKEIPPTLFPTRSPWCCSPEVPAHPYCTLIESPNARLAGSNRQAQPQSARPDPTQGPRKKGKLSYKSNSQSAQPLKVSKKPRDQKDDGCGPASPSYNRGSCSKQEHGFI